MGKLEKIMTTKKQEPALFHFEDQADVSRQTPYGEM